MLRNYDEIISSILEMDADVWTVDDLQILKRILPKCDSASKPQTFACFQFGLSLNIILTNDLGHENWKKLDYTKVQSSLLTLPSNSLGFYISLTHVCIGTSSCRHSRQKI